RVGGTRDRGVDVGHLERDVVRPGSVAIEEAAQEVVDGDVAGLEQLDLHAVRVSNLVPVEARVGTTTDVAATEIAGVAIQTIPCAFECQRDVVEIDLVGHADQVTWRGPPLASRSAGWGARPEPVRARAHGSSGRAARRPRAR